MDGKPGSSGIGASQRQIREQAERDLRGDRIARTRLCALTRQERPVGELIRFVAGPDGCLHADLACRLPGRGVWVTAERKAVEKAISRGTFARSLKTRVTVSPKLADTIAFLLRRRAVEALSLANKAGLVAAGFEKVDTSLERGEVFLLLHGSDGALGGRERLNRKFQAISSETGRPCEIRDCFTIDELGLAIGRPNVVHAAVKVGGLADRFAEDTARLLRYSGGLDLCLDASAGREADEASNSESSHSQASLEPVVPVSPEEGPVSGTASLEPAEAVENGAGNDATGTTVRPGTG